jgi:hypothetical protein
VKKKNKDNKKKRNTIGRVVRVCLGTENCLAALRTDILWFLTSMLALVRDVGL